MSGLEGLLEKVGEFQGKHAVSVVVIALAVTLIAALGIPNLRMETDTNKELPQDMPIIQLQDKVRAEYGGYDMVLVLVRVDYSATQKNAVRDIRDPRVMEFLLELEDYAIDEKGVDKVSSVASVYRGREVPGDIADVRKNLSKIPEMRLAYNRDYSATMMQIYADLGSAEKPVIELSEAIKRDIDASSIPPGVKVDLTGTPPVRVLLMDTLQKDALFTIGIASFAILLVLVLINRPWIRGVLVFAPLTFGLVWTVGTMGWLGINLSIATVGVGAMILGLGVEYGVFYVGRYEEERRSGECQLEAIKTAIREVGSAIIGSSSTTILGFLALLLASMPMLHHLGISLAMGIFYCVLAALGVNPCLIIITERVFGGAVRETDKKCVRGGTKT